MKSEKEFNSLVEQFLEEENSKEGVISSMVKMEDCLQNLSADKASEMLKKLSSSKPEITSYNKPLWNEEVKKSTSALIPEIDLDSLERSFNFVKKEAEPSFSAEDPKAPFNSLLSKWIFVFGDLNYPSTEVVYCVHDYLNKWIISLLRLFSSYNWKKVLQLIFPRETERLSNIKRLSLSSNYKAFMSNDLELSEDNPQNLLEDLFDDQKNLEEQEKLDRLVFHDKRTQKMSQEDYLDYTKAKTIGFQSLGYRKKFQILLESLGFKQI